MVKNILKIASIFLYISSVVNIHASSESHKTIQCYGLRIGEQSLSQASGLGRPASSESYFILPSRSNTLSLIYDRKNNYQLVGTRANLFPRKNISPLQDVQANPSYSNSGVNAAILDNNKLVTAQSYGDGLWVDSVDSNAPAQHTALPSFPDIHNNAYVEHLKSVPNNLNSLLIGIFAGKYIHADLESEKATQILPNTFIAQAIPDNTGNGIWYLAVEQSGIKLRNGSEHLNNRVGHYDMRSGKTTLLVLLPDTIKEISLNKKTDRCLLNMSDGIHYVYDIGTLRRTLKYTNRSNFDSNHAFFVNDGTVVYFVKTPDTNNLTLTTYMVGIDDSHKSVTLSSSGNETAYLENSQLLVAYDGNSAEKVYEFSAE